MFTLLRIALRLPDTFRGVSRAINVGYFFLMEAQPEVRYVHTTLYSVKLPDTFMGVSRAVENGKTSFIAL